MSTARKYASVIFFGAGVVLYSVFIAASIYFNAGTTQEIQRLNESNRETQRELNERSH